MATPTTSSLTVGESPPTLGESMAHLSRNFALVLAYYAYKSDISPRPLSSNPGLLALLITSSAYFSLLCVVQNYACLFLPRTPVAIDEKIENIGMWGVGVFVIGVMVSFVLAFQVRDTRVLAACTVVAAVFIVGLVAFWVWLARAYGGDASESESELESSGVARLPV